MADELGAIAQLRLAIQQINETAERTAGISLRLGVAVDSMADELKKNREAWLQRATDAPRGVLLRFASTAPGTQPFTLQGPEVGGVGPQDGEVWALRACRVGGITPTTTAAGRADLFVSPFDPNSDAGPGPLVADWVDQSTALPNVAFYDSWQAQMRNPDNLYIVVTGGTAGQQYTANAFFEIYREGGYEAVVTL